MDCSGQELIGVLQVHPEAEALDAVGDYPRVATRRWSTRKRCRSALTSESRVSPLRVWRGMAQR
jgi:hypothetical protein